MLRVREAVVVGELVSPSGGLVNMGGLVSIAGAGSAVEPGLAVIPSGGIIGLNIPLGMRLKGNILSHGAMEAAG